MGLLISLLFLLLLIAVCYWIFTLILPHIPQPVQWVAQVVFAVICLVLLISLLWGGWSFPVPHPLMTR